jgi:hypothetical protein
LVRQFVSAAPEWARVWLCNTHIRPLDGTKRANIPCSRGIRSKPLTSARKYTDASNRRPGKLIADVIGVALVEIGLRNARGYLLSRPIHDIAESGHAEDYDTSRANETNA